MSKASEPDANSRNTLLLTGGWVLLILLIWLALTGVEERSLAIFLGRFHILIVHVPIGLLCIALIAEIMGRFPHFPNYRKAVGPMLVMGMLGAMAATVAGFMLMLGERESGSYMNIHMWTGLGVVVLSAVTLLLKMNGAEKAYLGVLVATVGMVSVSSHYGGSLVHDPEYLTEHAPAPLKALLGEGVETEVANEVVEVEKSIEEFVIYEEIIQPIFDNRCVQCHSAEKTKGGLRMDAFEELVKGGDIGDSFLAGEHFVDGEYPESELVFRVTLPADDDEFMPPGDKEPMTEAEIELLKWWITEGASPSMTVAEASDRDVRIETMLAAVVMGGDAEEEAPVVVQSWAELSEEDQKLRLEALEKNASEIGFTVMPLSADDERLRVSVMNAASSFGDKELELLAPVAGYIAWLDIGNSKVTDAGMSIVAQMKGLERLHLESTAVTDAGLAQLADLTHLTYLNLYATAVTDGVFSHLTEMSDLRKLFLWQTSATSEGKRDFERAVNVEVNLGWDLTSSDSSSPGDSVDDETVSDPGADPSGEKKAEGEKKVADQAPETKKEQATPPAEVKADAKD